MDFNDIPFWVFALALVVFLALVWGL